MALRERTDAAPRASSRWLMATVSLLANQLNKDFPLPRFVVQIDEDDLLPVPQDRAAGVEGDREARPQEGRPHVGVAVAVLPSLLVLVFETLGEETL
jgi:hypothetical protein